MAGYPPNPPGYGYSAPNPYGSAPPPPNPYGAAAAPYAAPPVGNQYGAVPQAPYGDKPPKDKMQAPYGDPYGAKPPKDNMQAPYGDPYGAKPHTASAPPAGGLANPFFALLPSVFPPGTDPNLVACFTHADQDRSGFIDDKELQRALSGYNQSFSLRTVHLLMYLFTGTNTRVIGPAQFSQVYYSLTNWRGIFDRYDRDRSGKIDANELREALLNLGFAVSLPVLDLLISKFDKTGGKSRAIEYDNFIECCLTVKGLTEKFKEKDLSFSGTATFGYDAFMLTVLPFLIA